MSTAIGTSYEAMIPIWGPAELTGPSPKSSTREQVQ